MQIPNSGFSLMQTLLVRRLYPPLAAAAPPSAAQSAKLMGRPAVPATMRPPSAAAAVPAAASGEVGQASPARVPSPPVATPEETELRGQLQKEPADVDANVKLSKLLLRAQRPAEAVDHLWPAVQAVPQEQSAPIRFQLALALSIQGQHEAAEPLLEQVLQIEPEFVECLLCLSGTQEALGKATLAVETLQRVAALKPEIKAWCDREVARIVSVPSAANGGDGSGGAGPGS